MAPSLMMMNSRDVPSQPMLQSHSGIKLTGNVFLLLKCVFSSPEQNAQWELLGHRDVRRPSSSVVRRVSCVVNNCL